MLAGMARMVARGIHESLDSRFGCAAVLIATAGVAIAPSARADWPVARQNPTRTGAANGTSNITKPVPYWRQLLGGRLSSTGLFVGDVDGDGSNEIAYSSAGRLVVRRANAEVAWQSESLRIQTIVGAFQLDGDGIPDLVVTTSDRVLVFQGATGAVEWAEAKGEMGTIGAVRAADMDGDKLDEVFVQECGCCGANSGKTGFLYSFKGGFANPAPTWSLPSITCGASISLALFDPEGSGQPRILDANVNAAGSVFEVRNGADGTVLATSPELEDYVAFSECMAANVDDIVGEEVVCVMSSPYAPSSTNHRLFVLKYAAGPVPSLSRLWFQDVGTKNGEVVTRPEFVVDLDADGQLEMVLSGQDGSGMATTYVYDARTGAELASMPGETSAGSAPAEADGISLILTQSGGTMNAWAFSRADGGATVDYRWSLVDRAPVRYVDPVRLATSSFPLRTLSVDQDGDGVEDLLTLRSYGGAELVAYKSSGNSPTPVATYVFPADAEPLLTLLAPPLDRPYPQVLTARNDGELLVFDQKLQPTAVGGTPGIQVGGFYASGAWRSLGSGPVAGSVGTGSTHAVLVPDSRNALVRLDPADATMTSGATIVWTRTHTWAPMIGATLDSGNPGVACLRIAEPVTVPPTHEVALLNAFGTPIWKVSIPQTPFNDLLPGKASAGESFISVQWGAPSDGLLRTRALSAKDGATLWENTPSNVSGNRQPAGASVADWDFDGVEDVVHQYDELRIISGATGQEIAAANNSSPYFLPTLFDVDGDQELEVTLHGGYGPARTLKHDLTTTLWSGDVDDRPYPYGAIAACPGLAPRLVEGSWASPSRLRSTPLAGINAGQSVDVILADGKAYSTVAQAEADHANLGQLASVSVHNNLSGTGRPTALVGSTDGWLYGFNPCSGTIDFVYNFGLPVGDVIFGDTDGDGMDEILASVGDGYLYGLKNESISGPAWVWDTDPPHGITSSDVDTIVTQHSLFARWSAVPGADGYELIVSDGSTVLSTPKWVPVGNVTEATVGGLPLKAGIRYFVGVRATSGTLRSPDKPSDGVVVVEEDAGSEAGLDAAPDTFADTPDDINAEKTIEAQADIVTDPRQDGFAPPGPSDAGVVEGAGCDCSLGHPSGVGARWNATGWAFLLVRLAKRRRRRLLS